MVRKILGGLLVIIVAALGIGLLLPSEIHVERSIVIHAAPHVVFGYVDNFRNFNRWSPWAKLDPDTQYTFSGPDSGVGARMEWHSENPNVGMGSQEIIASEPDRHVAVRLTFGDMEPAAASYDLLTVNGTTKITWGFDQNAGFNIFLRYFGLMFDKFIGADYEKGLAELKTIVEAQPTGP